MYMVTLFILFMGGFLKASAQEVRHVFYDEICRDEIVDLGLSVKWASRNIGTDKYLLPGAMVGGLYGWADALGDKKSKKLKDYPCKTPPKFICGDAKWDIARARFGYPFRLPTTTEFQELMEKCKWEVVRYNGGYGYKVTGPNGNSIFLPATDEDHSRDFESCYYGNYWTGNLSYSDNKDAFVFCFFFHVRYGERIGNQDISTSTVERFTRCAIRAVCD